jgi:hypothetical protein
MLKSAWTVPRDFVIPGKKVDPVQLRYFMGIIGTLSVNLAFDVMMRGLGYEPDDEEGWKYFNIGRKYIKTEDTRLGPQEFTFTWSNPGNLPQRYLQRMARTWHDDEKSIFGKTLATVKWDLHPLINTIISMEMNRTPDGDQIYSQFDDEPQQKLKMLGFGISNLIKLTELGQNDILDIMPDSFKPEFKSRGKVLAEEYRAENFNALAKMLTAKVIGTMSFRARTPKIQRLKFEINQLKAMFKSEQARARLLMGKGEEYTPDKLKNLEKKIKRITDELDRIKEKE